MERYASRNSTTPYSIGHITPIAHQTRYIVNPNFIAAIKQDTYILLIIDFIHPIKEATWLSPIVVVPKRMESS